MILNRKDLFYQDNSNIQIKIYIGNNSDNINIIKNIITQYLKYLDENNDLYLGLDFEFNNKKIALAQLNLDLFTFDNKQVILIFNPEDVFDLFRKIILHKNLWIILHGSESLDLPFLIRDIVKKKKDMVKFFQKLIDTKFLCEFSIINDKDAKCKINYFLHQQKVISSKTLDTILQNEEKMGPIYLVDVNIKTLSPELLLYSSYDVIFLPELIRKLQINTPFIQIVRFLQINFMMKYDLLKDFNYTKDIIAKLNNSYFENVKSINNRLNDIISPLIEISQNKTLEKIKLIPGFKKIIDIIEKSYIYPIFINKFKIVLLTQDNLKPLQLPKEIQIFFTNLAKDISQII